MKPLIITFFLLFCLSQVSIAQNKALPRYLINTKKVVASGNYYEAIAKCEKAYKRLGTRGSIKEKGEVAFLLAESYRLLENYEKANDWYSRCIELKYFSINPEIYFLKGNMLKMQGDFTNAIKEYESYKKIAPNSMIIKVEEALKSCREYKDYSISESNFIIKSESKINSKEYDMSPAFSDKKGKKLYFVSNREESFGSERDPITGQKYMDIYMVTFDDKGNPSSKPVSIDTKGIINTSENEGALCFDSKKKTIFFTRCPNEKKMKLGCDIWMADVLEEDFENPVKITLKSNDSISVGHPCITEDGMMLIFASDMTSNSKGTEKSFGGKDLWYVNYDKKNKIWDSVAHNMGPEFNSIGNELFPTLGPNGKLYFASDGHPGIGGLDIFVTERVGSENKWSRRLNIGHPFNSPGNDYGMCAFDSKTGFFTSERKTNSSGEITSDIWSYYTPPSIFDLQVVVTESGSRKKIEGAKVEVVCVDKSKWQGVTDVKGKTEKWKTKKDNSRYILEDKTYELKVSKEGYYEDLKGAKLSTFGLDQSQSFLIEMKLVPKGVLTTPEVRYPLDQWTFINDATCMSKDSLNELYNLLSDNPNVTIELYSHTDARSSEKHNQVLSENRAKAVYKYLVDKGIDGRRIVPIGKGEMVPATYTDENGQEIVLTEDYINSFANSDPKKFNALHQINRRTTAKVISRDFDPETAPAADPSFLKYTTPLPK